jgi:hypothetical protein
LQRGFEVFALDQLAGALDRVAPLARIIGLVDRHGAAVDAPNSLLRISTRPIRSTCARSCLLFGRGRAPFSVELVDQFDDVEVAVGGVEAKSRCA